MQQSRYFNSPRVQFMVIDCGCFSMETNAWALTICIVGSRKLLESIYEQSLSRPSVLLGSVPYMQLYMVEQFI